MVWAHNVVTETFFQILHEYGVQSVQGDDAVGKVWRGCNLLNYVKWRVIVKIAWFHTFSKVVRGDNRQLGFLFVVEWLDVG